MNEKLNFTIIFVADRIQYGVNAYEVAIQFNKQLRNGSYVATFTTATSIYGDNLTVAQFIAKFRERFEDKMNNLFDYINLTI
jgi:hypothetical protein